MSRLLRDGPTAEEIERARTGRMAAFVRGVERIGGFGGKSDVLAKGQACGGRADAYRTSLERLKAATPASVGDAARRWLSDGVYVLEVHPFPKLTSSGTGVDRSKRPDAVDPPAGRLPPFQRATLPSGLKLVVAERHDVPVVRFQLVVDAGHASDSVGTPGLASLAADLLDEGTANRGAVYAPVQTDKTKESVQELLKEMRGIRGERPITADELQAASDSLVLTLAGRWETAGAVVDSIGETTRFGFPDDYYRTFAQRVRATTAAEVTAAAGVVRPECLVWVIAGDREKIEPGLRELGLGEIRAIDADGNVK